MCLPSDTPLSASLTVLHRRWYQGPGGLLALADGRLLRLTVKHPVLTHRGWTPAGRVQAGDWVVSHASEAPALECETWWWSLANDYDEQITHPLPRGFYGDSDARFPTHAIRTDPAWPSESPPTAEEGTAPPVVPGTAHDVLAALSRPEAFGCATWTAACRTVPGLDQAWPAGRPTAVGAGVPASTARRLGDALDALPEPEPDREALSRALLGLPGTLALTRVEAVTPRALSGWVYSAATVTGCYVANGVVVGG